VIRLYVHLSTEVLEKFRDRYEERARKGPWQYQQTNATYRDMIERELISRKGLALASDALKKGDQPCGDSENEEQTQ
jgi:hypothetical protein